MTTIGVRVDDSEKQALVEYAKTHDLTISQLIRRLIKEFLTAQEL